MVVLESLLIGGVATQLIGGVISAQAQIDLARRQGKIDEQTHRQLKEIYKKIEDNYKLPPGTAQPLTFEEFKLVGSYTPEIAQLVKEESPQLVTESGSAREIASQRTALSDYENLARTGDDAISRGAREQAAFEADQKLKSMRAQVLRDRAARGMLGSGDELLAELQGADTAAINARQQSIQAASDAQQRRMQALAAQTGLASQMRGQTGQTERANVEIMNSFNRRMAQDQNIYNQGAAQMRNQAQQANLAQAQSISNANIAGRTNINNQNITNQSAAEDRVRQALNERLVMSTQGEKDLLMKQAAIDSNKARVAAAPMIAVGGMTSSLGQSAMAAAPAVASLAAGAPPTSSAAAGGAMPIVAPPIVNDTNSLNLLPYEDDPRNPRRPR